MNVAFGQQVCPPEWIRMYGLVGAAAPSCHDESAPRSFQTPRRCRGRRPAGVQAARINTGCLVEPWFWPFWRPSGVFLIEDQSRRN